MSKGLSREYLEQLYLKLEKPLYNTVFRWVWNAAEAQDIVQDVFVTLWQKRLSIEADSVEAYAFKIAINKANNLRRWHKLRQLLPLSSEHENLLTQIPFDEQLHDNYTKQKLNQAVDKLPHKIKQALLLCEFSDFSYAQIGVILGISAGTVGSRRNKAITLLKKSRVLKSLVDPEDAER